MLASYLPSGNKPLCFADPSLPAKEGVPKGQPSLCYQEFKSALINCACGSVKELMVCAGKANTAGPFKPALYGLAQCVIDNCLNRCSSYGDGA